MSYLEVLKKFVLVMDGGLVLKELSLGQAGKNVV
jgi:hypothetical protein